MFQRSASAILLTLAVLAPLSPARSEPPRVVADILPVHGLVAAVMQGVGQPQLLLAPGTSPHHYAMRPSDARMLARAGIVFWIGPQLTPWLDRTLRRVAPEAEAVPLIARRGTLHLGFRAGPRFDAVDRIEVHGVDPHAWLHPGNAIVWTRAIAEQLSRRDPANAARYRTNAASAVSRIEALARRLKTELAPVRGRTYLVQHDALRYFEVAFALPAAGAIAAGDESRPGASRLTRIRAFIRRNPAPCVFTEPGAERRTAALVGGAGAVRIGVLDILGSRIPPGPDHFPALLSKLSAALTQCLGK